MQQQLRALGPHVGGDAERGAQEERALAPHGDRGEPPRGHQEDLLDAARKLAEEIAANPPLVVQGTKDVLDSTRGPQVAAGLRYVGAWNSAFLPSKDLAEAAQAFFERRPPNFSGQ